VVESGGLENRCAGNPGTEGSNPSPSAQVQRPSLYWFAPPAVLASNRAEILARLSDADLVLDVGGWADPLERADWVLDVMPYETRGGSRSGERFSSGSWVQRDACDRTPWPFDDGQFDFAVCAQTLEDVRDPIWVCSELQRVARAGYVEVPSRAEEQSFGIQGPWVGWGHHHWLVEPEGDGLVFVFKHHILQGRREMQLSREIHARMTAQERIVALFWERELRARERLFVGPGELDAWLAELVQRHGGPRPRRLRLPLG
jgi:hypothetical protein